MFWGRGGGIRLKKLEWCKEGMVGGRIMLDGIMEYEVGVNIDWFVMEMKR